MSLFNGDSQNVYLDSVHLLMIFGIATTHRFNIML